MSLYDFQLSSNQSFNVIVNSNLHAPVFASAVLSQTACIGCVNPPYQLPSFSDQDGDNVTLAVVSSLPSCVTFSTAAIVPFYTFIFNPTNSSDVGNFTITV
jgi:hypothetical protein